MSVPARVVYERWTHPVAADIIAQTTDVLTDRLDFDAEPAQNWQLLAVAHGYHAATRTVCSQARGGEQWLAGAQLVERCPALLAVTTAGAGYDVVDVVACTEAGVIVCNNSGPGAEAVAEHALALMLALAKKVVLADRSMRAGHGRDREVFRGSELLAKTMGVVGLGAIGSRLIELVAPLRMTILVHDPYVDAARSVALGAQLVAFDELLERSDVVQVTCPLTPETEGLFGRAAFTRMKSSAFFVTTARGQVHDEAALVDALRDGDIAGAGVDVFHVEPVPTDHPLFELDNVIVTPHSAGVTVEATHNLAVAAAQQWLAIFGGAVPQGVVNPKAWPRYQERFATTFGTRPHDLT